MTGADRSGASAAKLASSSRTDLALTARLTLWVLFQPNGPRRALKCTARRAGGLTGLAAASPCLLGGKPTGIPPRAAVPTVRLRQTVSPRRNCRQWTRRHRPNPWLDAYSLRASHTRPRYYLDHRFVSAAFDACPFACRQCCVYWQGANYLISWVTVQDTNACDEPWIRGVNMTRCFTARLINGRVNNTSRSRGGWPKKGTAIQSKGDAAIQATDRNLFLLSLYWRDFSIVTCQSTKEPDFAASAFCLFLWEEDMVSIYWHGPHGRWTKQKREVACTPLLVSKSLITWKGWVNNRTKTNKTSNKSWGLWRKPHIVISNNRITGIF